MARKEIRYEKMEAKERDQLTCRPAIFFKYCRKLELMRVAAEFSILSALRHPNIVEYHHREHVKEHQMVYMYVFFLYFGERGKSLGDEFDANCDSL